MKMNVLMMIETGMKESSDAKAFGKEYADIYITAATIEAALALLPVGRKKAEKAMENWTPEEVTPAENTKPVRGYCRSRYTAEEMDEAAADYEETYNGRRFMASVKNAREFYFKHSNPRAGVTSLQLVYLANKHYNSLLNGSFDLTAIAYRQGYRDGQKALKESKKV